MLSNLGKLLKATCFLGVQRLVSLLKIKIDASHFFFASLCNDDYGMTIKYGNLASRENAAIHLRLNIRFTMHHIIFRISLFCLWINISAWLVLGVSSFPCFTLLISSLLSAFQEEATDFLSQGNFTIICFIFRTLMYFVLYKETLIVHLELRERLKSHTKCKWYKGMKTRSNDLFGVFHGMAERSLITMSFSDPQLIPFRTP